MRSKSQKHPLPIDSIASHERDNSCQGDNSQSNRFKFFFTTENTEGTEFRFF